MPTVVSLGSINADFVHRLDGEVPRSGSVITEGVLRTAGGKAANVAVFARRIGLDACLVGQVGDDDLAEQALAGPRRAGVDLRYVRTVPGATGISTVLVPPHGSKSIILALGANGSAWPTPVSEALRVVEPPAVLVVDLEIPAAVVADAVAIARDRGVPVVIDPAPADALPDALVACADHLTPDHIEAGVLADIDVHDDESGARAAALLHERGAGAVYVKLEHGGCAVAWSGGQAIVCAPDVEVVDTTGAGDAFTAAVAWACLHGWDPRRAAVAGVAASTCTVRQLGSQEAYPTADQLNEMIRRVDAG